MSLSRSCRSFSVFIFSHVRQYLNRPNTSPSPFTANVHLKKSFERQEVIQKTRGRSKTRGHSKTKSRPTLKNLAIPGLRRQQKYTTECWRWQGQDVAFRVKASCQFFPLQNQFIQVLCFVCD